MGLFQAFCDKFLLQCRSCAFNQQIFIHSSKLVLPVLHRFPPCYKLGCSKFNNLYHVKEVMCILPYSTGANNTASKNSDGSETKSKKKKEFKVFITLLGTDGNIISVTTVEEAAKLASRRNLRLVKALDLDSKSGRAVYKLMTESEYLESDKEWEDAKSQKENKSRKGDKLVPLSSFTAEHDIRTKVKMMQKWLEKKFEVRVVISGDLKNGENVFKIIEKEIGTEGRIVQKRSKGQDIRFQILPAKKIEETHTKEDTKKGKT